MCRFLPFQRYETHKILKHPWISRDANSTIPESFTESINRKNIISEFKIALKSIVALTVYKLANVHLFSDDKKVKKVEIKTENKKFKSHKNLVNLSKFR